MSAIHSITRAVKAAGDAAITLLWIAVLTTYLIGLHHEARMLANAAAGWTLAWFLIRHPGLVLEFAFAGLAVSAAVAGQPRQRRA
jgi:hypothetical protein